MIEADDVESDRTYGRIDSSLYQHTYTQHLQSPRILEHALFQILGSSHMGDREGLRSNVR